MFEYDNKKAFIEYNTTRDINLRNEIALNNKNLIYDAIKGLYSPNVHDVEEIEQEAFISLLEAVETFDINKGVEFSTYAYKCIKSLTRKRIEYNTNVSINAPVKNCDGENIELLDTIKDTKADTVDIAFKNELPSKINKVIDKRLTDIEAYVLRAKFLQEKTYTLIAKELNIKLSKVMRLKNKALKKLERDPFFREYKKDFISKNEVNYLKAYQYSFCKSSKTNNISSPVWSAILQRENLNNKMYRGFLNSK